jgi:mono/diheme cytochrome c family protein
LRVFRLVFAEEKFGMAVAVRSVERFIINGGTMKRKLAIATITTAIFLFGAIFYGAALAQGEAQPSDPAAYYKAKCVVCHGPKAEKKFDPALTEEQYMEAILKGKKPEKPPNMPAYGDKGVTQEQAKALLDHMKQLRTTQ